MLVYVLNKHGLPLMPCSPRKARVLLKEGRAKVVKRTPFTIQLLYGSSGYKQPIKLGVDSGYQNIGLSATTAKKEIFSAEVKLRKDIVELNSERRSFRRARRGRKTRYRKARFQNRRKKEGWLAPSIQHKLDSHYKAILMVEGLLPITEVVIEVANFDIQKIKNPAIAGKGYQEGEQMGFWNVREYVLYRDAHICQHCKGKTKDKVLEVHHIETRRTGGNRPDNLITLCSTCHHKVSTGKLKLKVKVSNGFKQEAFMSMARWRLVDMVGALPTYGYITKHQRIGKGLEKSHINDAFIIAGGDTQERIAGYNIQQVRKCNRKLYKGIRSHIKNTAPRFVHGFQRYDKVSYQDMECFIAGRSVSGGFVLSLLDGSRVRASYKKLQLLESANTFLVERREPVSSPA